jgi:enolase
MSKIKSITAREILDAKGNPTVETTVVLSDDIVASAACPSGTSVGAYEAMELRDGDPARYAGHGVLKAIDNVQKLIAPKLIGKEAANQAEVDRAMIEYDGTQNKGMLGANATLSVSMAVARAASRSSKTPLYMHLREFINSELVPMESFPLKVPTPLFNILNGGKHADMNLDFQEFMVIPASSKAYPDALLLGTTVYKALASVLKTKKMDTLVGDEGGFAPTLPTNMDAFSLLTEAIGQTSFRLGYDIFLGLDAAANSFLTQQKYKLKDREAPYTKAELISYYETLNKNFHLLYLEDPLSEDDWEGWAELTGKITTDTLVVGDDLTATNPYRLQTAIDKKAMNGIIIKPNQIGTVIEALAVVQLARHAGMKITVSHRSGETNDDFIADFAVAVSADYVKFGAPARGERVAKYNRLMQIYDQLSVQK